MSFFYIFALESEPIRWEILWSLPTGCSKKYSKYAHGATRIARYNRIGISIVDTAPRQ